LFSGANIRKSEGINGAASMYARKSRQPGILDILLDLALLPTRGGIAKLRRKDVVVRHREGTDIDLSFLATTDAIDRGFHVIVNAATRHTAKHAEPVPMSVEGHLVRL